VSGKWRGKQSAEPRDSQIKKNKTYSAFVRREPAEVTCEWVNATKRIASVGDSK
jgi:hypothetical protein